jgi:hypothetical protein
MGTSLGAHKWPVTAFVETSRLKTGKGTILLLREPVASLARRRAATVVNRKEELPPHL